MKIGIVYVSKTGNTEVAAEFIEDGILGKYPFIQVRTMDIREGEVDVEFPVYFTSMSWELKRWFDNSFRVNLQGKLGAAFVTAQSLTGGTDTAIMEMIRHMLVKGMLVYSGMSGKNRNHFQIGAMGMGKNLEASREELEAFGADVAEKTIEISRK